jgi:hypothetical protein
MSHSAALYLALFVAPLGVACDKAGADTEGASSDAGAAATDFGKARDDYREQKRKDLAKLDKSIADVDAKEKVATTKTKADLDGMLAALRAQRSAFVADLGTIDRTGASDWDATRARLDKEWDDLSMASDKAVGAAAAAAASVFTPGQMTCRDFLALPDGERPKIVYWEEGFNKNGKPMASAVDLSATDQLVPVLVAECNKTPTEPLSKAVQAHPLDNLKVVASAPKPTSMTCQDFVALEDVAQPRVVYWSEGFNKDAGPADAVVDIDGTDRLVPILVQECKATPKLTFWEKIKKYF